MSADDDFDEITVMKADLVEDALDKKIKEEGAAQRQTQMVHIQFQQRTTRKCLTLIQGLSPDIDFKKLLRHFKKMWNCNGTLIQSDEWGQVIQLQGDNRRAVSKFLIEEGLAEKEEIKIHGI